MRMDCCFSSATGRIRSLMGDYFTMILRVEFDADKVSIQTIKEHMRPVAEEKHQSIRIQSEDLFTAMNEI